MNNSLEATGMDPNAGKQGAMKYADALWGEGLIPDPRLAEHVTEMFKRLVVRIDSLDTRTNRLEGRVKELEGLVETLRKHSIPDAKRKTKKKKTPPAAILALGPDVVTMQQILSRVAKKHGLTQGTIKSDSRLREVVQARNEAFYYSQKLGKSLPQIGRFFGRDHTSVLHGIKRHKQRMEAAE